MACCICSPMAQRNQSHSDSGTNLPPNGVVQITTTVLHTLWNSQGCCTRLVGLSDSETELEPHPLKMYSIPNELNLPEITSVTSKSMANLLEVYMNDFFGMMQVPTIKELHKFTRSILYGIHSVFLLPGPSKDATDEPISIKKLKAGNGLWSTQKEILGWLFNGISQCMQLPNDKVTKICTHLIQISRQKLVYLGELEKLNGCLMHAMISIPNGRGLLLPLIATIATKGKSKYYKNKMIWLNSETQ